MLLLIIIIILYNNFDDNYDEYYYQLFVIISISYFLSFTHKQHCFVTYYLLKDSPTKYK